jgi:hypothetical protein
MKIVYYFNPDGWLQSELRLEPQDEPANLGRPDVTEKIPPEQGMIDGVLHTPRFIDGDWELVPDSRVPIGPPDLS